jgi:hypothetical protein
MKKKPVIKRILDKTVKTKTCWLFKGANVNGYGRIKDTKGKLVRVHRYIYQLINGKILPIDVDVLHKCDVRNCWRPSHLFEGNDIVNSLDRVKKGRQVKGKRQYFAKLDNNQVRMIRIFAERGFDYILLGWMFRVDPSNISRIVNRKTWKDAA